MPVLWPPFDSFRKGFPAILILLLRGNSKNEGIPELDDATKPIAELTRGVIQCGRAVYVADAMRAAHPDFGASTSRCQGRI
jgi:hypothetical protein